MPENFSYVIAGKLAGSACPGMWSSLEDDLAQLRRMGFSAVVSLTEKPLSREALEAQGLVSYHIPILDFKPPTPDQIREFVGSVQNQLSRDAGPVLVHCRAGIGRTGTMLAAYLVTCGLSAEDAIGEVRRLRPGSIETAEQENAVRSWESILSGQGRGDDLG